MSVNNKRTLSFPWLLWKYCRLTILFVVVGGRGVGVAGGGMGVIRVEVLVLGGVVASIGVVVLRVAGEGAAV